ncbi:hypothetical protein C0991_005778 [Blastosporella zonata]|nr:hypothetical protein C0991_005778 [Blastosporella zonata]
MSKTTPTEDELKAALVALKIRFPSLGIAKTHSVLLASYPDWLVSEKRTRKVLQSEGLILDTPIYQGADMIYPSSRLIPDLDIPRWTSKVQVRYYDKRKGKGLVATEDIKEGEIIWREDPFILSPECFFSGLWLLLHPFGSVVASYPTLSRLELFIVANALRLPLLQPPLPVTFRQAPPSFVLLPESRMSGSAEPDRESWKKAHAAVLQAFRSPKSPADQKSLAKILKKPISPVVEKALFEFDGFLRGLGKMSLNLEAHGGLYTLHSHLNHSCTPNVSVRHNDRRTALSRITVIAKRHVVAGEELFISYVNPELDVRRRRQELQAWGFGDCTCVRCLQEAKHIKPEENEGMDDLASELKASLGVM